jgi:hypothetical protein
MALRRSCDVSWRRLKGFETDLCPFASLPEKKNNGAHSRRNEELDLAPPLVTLISSSSFKCIASVSRFCVFLDENTIRKVTIAVPVFIRSCHVSL